MRKRRARRGSSGETGSGGSVSRNKKQREKERGEECLCRHHLLVMLEVEGNGKGNIGGFIVDGFSSLDRMLQWAANIHYLQWSSCRDHRTRKVRIHMNTYHGARHTKARKNGVCS